jgi:hypothetical protein
MDAAPYYAPTYFPASYFYSATAPPATPTGVAPYYAPTYFPASYFYSANTTSPVVAPVPPVVTPSPAEPTGRDAGAYSALLSLLRASGIFEEVIFGDALQRSQAGADTYPLAVLTPKGWEESDDFDPALIVRRVTFAITVVIKSADSGTQFDALDRLASAIQKAVDRSGLGGGALAALTKIRSGRYGQTTRYPEQSIELGGEFASLFDPLATPIA